MLAPSLLCARSFSVHLVLSLALGCHVIVEMSMLVENQPCLNWREKSRECESSGRLLIHCASDEKFFRQCVHRDGKHSAPHQKSAVEDKTQRLHSCLKVERKLYWYLKLFFSQSDAVYTDRVPEDKVLEGILSDYFHPAESDPIKQQKLKMYVVAPRDQIYVFMKSEQRLPNSLKYHELDVKKTIRENLMFKTVVEYPEFHVVLKGHDEEYRTQVSGQSIFSSRPPSSEAPGVLQSHMVRPGKETTAQSELEDGELRSDVDDDRDDDGDDDDKQENRNVSCHVSHGEVDENEEEEDNCTSEDKSLIKVLKDP